MNTQNIDELLIEISQLKEKVKILKKQKRYGLVWEDKPELFDTESKNALPVLIEKSGRFKDIISDESEDFNILIEGDNYHSLSVLKYTHRNKVDVIYIDPPYNTGNKDFIYNDHIIDREDSFRHSKWLSFMSKRLRLAKDLLKDSGVIFISIDDNEQAQLKLLGSEIFGENNFESIIWKKKGGAGNTEKILGNLTEYILCFFVNKQSGVLNYRDIKRTYRHEDKLGPYNLESVEKTNLGLYERKTMLFPVTDPKSKQIFLPGKDKRWTLGELKMDQLISEQKIYFDTTKKRIFRIKRALDYENSDNVYYNLLTDMGSLSTAKDELKDILKNRELFDTPKPTRLIKELLNISSSKNSLILDFMAGSGTTGHAVLDLNKEDGGNRKFILCTNNENKICEDVTYERIKRVSQGYTNSKGEKVEGLGGNLKYLKTDFITIDSSIDDLKQKIVEASTQILCLKEGTFNKKDEQEKIKVFENGDTYTAILFDTFYLNEFKDLLNTLTDKPISVYVFAYDKNFSKEEFSDINSKINYSVEPIPEKLLETYQEIFNF